jgi:hypothetical protein
MGINIYLEDEKGKMLDSVVDESQAFAHFIRKTEFPNTLCLRFIDPYGDTVFNKPQLPVLEMELRELLKTISIPALQESLRRIIDLVVKARNEVHVYIKFRGD